MADINYPAHLPQFELGKDREQPQGFRTTEPFAGTLFVEKITDDKPVIWTGSVFCKNALIARSFVAFVKSVENGKLFNMPILTENGFITHEVRFIQEPLTPQQITQDIWRYTFKIMSRQLINPDEAINNPELVANWLHQANIIDIAANQSWPES